jgi:hypothetical protein
MKNKKASDIKWSASVKMDNGGTSKLEGDLISKVIMNRNRGVDFVDRAYALGDNPGTPMFNLPDDEQFGQNMSHKMAWGEDDNGQSWMYPTIMNPNNEAIQVPNQYADYISSEGYKNATGMNQYKAGGAINNILKKDPSNIKWSASVKMANGGFTNKFVVGGQPPCGPGEAPDPITGLCSAVNMSQNFPEVDVYSKASTRKLQGTLTEKLQQMRNAFQNSRARNGRNGDKYNFSLNLGDETNDVKELPGRIARYKQAIELEKTKFAQDSYTLKQLKKYDPEHWDLKDQSKRFQRKAYEARSAEGLAALRSAVKRGAMSQEDFDYAYRDWGKHVDQNAVQGKGPGAVYSGKAAKEIWGDNMNAESFKPLGYALTGLLGGIGGGLLLPGLLPALGTAASAVGSGVSSLGAAIAPAWTTAMGTTASQIPGLTSLAGSTIGNVSLGNYLAASSAYSAGKGLIDGSTWEANKKVYDDMKNGEFNLKNITNAASKDLSLLTNFSKVMPNKVIPDLKLDKTKGVVNVLQTAEDPTKFDPIKLTKGLIAAGNKKYGGTVNDILKKYPNFNIHNNALDIYLNGGSVT